MLHLTVRHSLVTDEFRTVDPVSKIKSWILLATVVCPECSVLYVQFDSRNEDFMSDLQNGPSIKQHLFSKI